MAVVGLIVLYNGKVAGVSASLNSDNAITGAFNIHPYFIHRPECFSIMDRPCYDILVMGPTWITLKPRSGEKLFDTCMKMPSSHIVSNFPAVTDLCGSGKVEKVNLCELGSGYYVTQFTGKCGNNTFPYLYE
ncbi:hypothetical protein HYW20_02680 [Candidatus Woesearchaeota archaeon]|nr:hypothetical protein [Candidatus Woesearchaeota archaeon]